MLGAGVDSAHALEALCGVALAAAQDADGKLPSLGRVELDAAGDDLGAGADVGQLALEPARGAGRCRHPWRR